MKDRHETPHLIPMAISVLRTSHTLWPLLVSDVRLQMNENDVREREIKTDSSSMVFWFFSCSDSVLLEIEFTFFHCVDGLWLSRECITFLSIEHPNPLLLQCRCSVQRRVKASIDIDRCCVQAGAVWLMFSVKWYSPAVIAVSGVCSCCYVVL